MRLAEKLDWKGLILGNWFRSYTVTTVLPKRFTIRNFIFITLHSAASSKLSPLDLFSSLTVYALWSVLFTVTFTLMNVCN
jgi:hypothetical protein